MSVSIRDVDTLQRYLENVIEKAEHHAPNIREVLLVLAGAVVLLKDRNEPIRIRTRQGQLANELWAYINGTRYAFSYNHRTQSVEVRQGSHSGNVAARFNNRTRPRQVLALLSQL